MADDLIDFSDRDGEFLSSEEKQQALSFAIITAVVGFVLSSWLFVSNKMGPASEILDRRAAEGRVVTQRKGGGGSSNESYGGFQAPRIDAARTKKRKRKRPAWKDLQVVSKLDKASRRKFKKSEPIRVKKTSIGVVPDHKKRAGPTKNRPVAVKKRARNEDLSRLLFPVVDSRPTSGTLESVEADARGNLIAISDARGYFQVGFVLDSQGRAIISSDYARSDYLNRMWAKGSLRQGRLLAIDREFGVALISVSGGDFKDLPLAPAPPTTGESLLAFSSRGRQGESRSVYGGISFGKAGFFVEGDLTSKSLGTTLLNKRGEVVGAFFETLPGAPGRGIHLACDSSVLHRLLKGYQGGGSRANTVGDAVNQLERFLKNAELKGESRRGRILPGVGLSDFHLGMTKDDVKKWASDPEVSGYSNEIERWDCPAPPVSLYFVRNRLALASTDHNGFSTSTGLAVGAEARYRELLKRSPSLEQSQGLLTASGLEIFVDSSNRVSKFVVKPELAKR